MSRRVASNLGAMTTMCVIPRADADMTYSDARRSSSPTTPSFASSRARWSHPSIRNCRSSLPLRSMALGVKSQFHSVHFVIFLMVRRNYPCNLKTNIFTQFYDSWLYALHIELNLQNVHFRQAFESGLYEHCTYSLAPMLRVDCQSHEHCLVFHWPVTPNEITENLPFLEDQEYIVQRRFEVTILPLAREGKPIDLHDALQ